MKTCMMQPWQIICYRFRPGVLYLSNTSERHAVQSVISNNWMRDRVCRLVAASLYITKDVSWCFPVCLLRSVLANLFLQASFLRGCYVTHWHPVSTPLGPVTLNVNTCLFPYESSGTDCALKSVPASKLQLHSLLSSAGQKQHILQTFSPQAKLESGLHLFYWVTGNSFFIASP